jgi:hypothetical protein
LGSIAATETFDRAKGFLFASAADEPPWRLGSKEDENHEWELIQSASVKRYREGGTHRKDPLQSERTSPCPFIVSLVVSVGGGSDDNSTNRPTHLKSGCAGAAKDERNNLTGIGGRIGNEQSPRDAFKCLSDNKNFK